MKIQKIKNLAYRAGQEILKYYKKDYKLLYKNGDKNSPLTDADLASERIILEELKKTKIPILSEESEDSQDRLNSDWVWIVDPLDGTSDFIDQTGDFCVMIGLVNKGKPVLGVVYLPIKNCYYYAQKGLGSYRQLSGKNPEKIKVSFDEDFSQMKLLVSRNHLKREELKLARKLKLKTSVCGSAGIKISRIAEGKANFYLNISDKTSQWDTCAGAIILKEAGGLISDVFGQELSYNGLETAHKKGFIVSSGFGHQKVVEILRNYF